MREAAGSPKFSTLLFLHAMLTLCEDFDPGSVNNTNPYSYKHIIHIDFRHVKAVILLKLCILTQFTGLI
jgi:hypothetical protein